MYRSFCSLLFLVYIAVEVAAEEPTSTRKVVVGGPAPAFTIKDATGKDLNLAELTAKGPVLVRLTCGCAGCDKELAYFQKLHDAYLAILASGSLKMNKLVSPWFLYAADRKLNMLYAVDPKGQSWEVFETKTRILPGAPP